MIKFRCIECQHKIAVPNDYEGKYVKCPACRAPTLVRQKPINVQVTTGVGVVAAPAPTVRRAAPVSTARAAQIPEARPARSSTTGLAHSQASELVKALGQSNPPSTTGIPEELSLQLNQELTVDPAPVSTEDHDRHVPHPAEPPQYLFMQGLGFLLIALGATAAMLWLVGLVAALTNAQVAAAIPVAQGPLLAIIFGISFIGILCVLAAGQALLALRDIARNAWHQKKTAALVRQPPSQ